MQIIDDSFGQGAALKDLVLRLAITIHVHRIEPKDFFEVQDVGLLGINFDKDFALVDRLLLQSAYRHYGKDNQEAGKQRPPALDDDAPVIEQVGDFFRRYVHHILLPEHRQAGSLQSLRLRYCQISFFHRQESTKEAGRCGALTWCARSTRR